MSETEALTPASMPDHISNDVDRKLVKEFQITLSRFADAAANDANADLPYMPKSIRKALREYVRVVDELRRRTNLSFTPPRPTKFEKLSDEDLINEVREAEMMVIMAPLLPKDKKCQLHICKLVSGEMPSLEVPSSEPLSFVEEFDKHIETRKRYDAWKVKEAKEPRPEGQMNPDCAPE